MKKQEKRLMLTSFIVGDQICSLPGWQEGAIAAALNVISRMPYPELKIPHFKNLPDTRLMVLNMGSLNLVFKSEGNQRSQNYAANLQNDLNMLAPGLSI